MKNYIEPRIKITQFECENIVTSSSGLTRSLKEKGVEDGKIKTTSLSDLFDIAY